MSSKKKSEVLGMSHGKANHILRKSLMFEMVKKSGDDNCFRCGNKIEKIEELSIDHIEDWENSNNPVELFFDISNISFSHLRCNISHGAKKSKNSISKNIKKSSVIKNKSGFKNVFKTDGAVKRPYRVMVKKDGIMNKGLYFSDAIEAAKAADILLIELYGESAATNKKLGLL